MKICVVITTYNRPDALMAVLEGYLAQNYKDYELIVADDGSTIETKNVITAYQTQNIINIKHAWHEDKGFRAAAIRNLAISKTSADYLIFGDGDCVPLPDFVDQHKRLAERNWFVAGSRVLLGKKFTSNILKKNISVHRWTSLDCVPSGHSARCGESDRLSPCMADIDPYIVFDKVKSWLSKS